MIGAPFVLLGAAILFRTFIGRAKFDGKRFGDEWWRDRRGRYMAQIGVRYVFRRFDGSPYGWRQRPWYAEISHEQAHGLLTAWREWR